MLKSKVGYVVALVFMFDWLPYRAGTLKGATSRPNLFIRQPIHLLAHGKWIPFGTRG